MTDFNEPWHYDDEEMELYDSKGQALMYTQAMDEDVAKRVEACVNACKGYSTHFLEQLAESQLPIPIDEADKPGGDTEAQARAWRHVWGKLVDMGMLSKGPFVNASTRALAFLDTLQSKEDSND